MAYRADIEIAVKGAQELKRLQNEINATSKLVDGLNNYLTNIGSGGITRSINNLRNAVSSAADAFNKAALGTDEATIAATKYVQATDKLNAGLRERSALLDKITRQERAAAMVRVGVGMPAQQLLLPAARQGAPAMGGGARRRITGPVERLGGARTADEAAMALRFAQGLKEQVRPLSQIEALYAGITGEALKLQGIKALPDTQMLNASVRGIKQLETAEDMRNRELQETAQRLENIDRLEASRQRRAAKLRGIQDYYATPTTGGMANAGAGIQGPVMPPGGITKRGPGLGANLLKRLPGAISGGIIGGSFPLLFGQGGGAAAGGLVGGLAGGLLGPGGSFAGSLLGTLLGDIASQGQKIKQLGLDIGFSAQQANVLADGFKKANTDIEKFTGVVQNIRGLGLELEDQAELIKLTTSLTEKYGGQFDKVGSAITSALESGKVSQGTLNQLTSQGVNIQQALADKLGVSKDQLLEMAKKGKIDIQDLVDVLVDMGNKGVEATTKSASGMEQLSKAAQGLGTALGDLGAAIMKALKPALDWLAGALAGIIGLATRAINAMANMLSGGTAETALANARARERLAAEGGPSVGTRYVAQKYQKRLEELQKEEQDKIVVPDSKVKPIDVSSLGRAPSSGGGGTDKAEKAAAREAARVAELVREQQLITLEYQKQQEIGAKIFAAEMARDPMLVRRLQGEQQLAEWGVKTANLLEKESSTAGKLAIAKAQQAEQALIRQKIEQDMAKIEQERKDRYDDIILDLDLELKLRTATTEEARQQLRIENEIQKLKKAGFTPAQIADIAQKKQQAAAPLTPQETIAQRAGALSDELTKLVSLGTQVTQIAESIGTAFGESFKGVISGAMTAQEALSSFFQSVADRFLDMAAQIIAKWIEMTILNSVLSLFPGGGMGLGGAVASAGKLNPTVGFGAGPLGFRAAGGPVSAGSPYMVGERGPELFVPGRSGSIVANHDLGGGPTSVVVNVDASGSNVQGNGNEANQLGKVIGLAVQQELIKQKRPGGLLA